MSFDPSFAGTLHIPLIVAPMFPVSCPVLALAAYICDPLIGEYETARAAFRSPSATEDSPA